MHLFIIVGDANGAIQESVINRFLTVSEYSFNTCDVPGQASKRPCTTSPSTGSLTHTMAEASPSTMCNQSLLMVCK